MTDKNFIEIKEPSEDYKKIKEPKKRPNPEDLNDHPDQHLSGSKKSTESETEEIEDNQTDRESEESLPNTKEMPDPNVNNNPGDSWDPNIEHPFKDK